MKMSQSMGKAAQAYQDYRVSTWAALAQAQSPLETVELQTALARIALDEAIEQMNRLADTWMKVDGQTMAPISAPTLPCAARLPKAV